jgi:hypothetical protein
VDVVVPEQRQHRPHGGVIPLRSDRSEAIARFASGEISILLACTLASSRTSEPFDARCRGTAEVVAGTSAITIAVTTAIAKASFLVTGPPLLRPTRRPEPGVCGGRG